MRSLAYNPSTISQTSAKLPQLDSVCRTLLAVNNNREKSMTLPCDLTEEYGFSILFFDPIIQIGSSCSLIPIWKETWRHWRRSISIPAKLSKSDLKIMCWLKQRQNIIVKGEVSVSNLIANWPNRRYRTWKFEVLLKQKQDVFMKIEKFQSQIY